ncbi:MAG: type II toxin-antitoxin system VapC family toxin [Acidimicrobiales bacterium]
MGVTLLLDTHVLLWAAMEPEKLSAAAMELLENPENNLLVSAASAWEIATKFRLGKLPHAKAMVRHYGQALTRLRAQSLPVTDAHALQAGSWPIAHRDPFDRMLAAQAHLETVSLVSADSALDEFGIGRIW